MIASPHSELSYPAVAPVPSPEITGEALDRLTRLAARFLAVPAAVISWEEQGRQVIVSSYGLSGAGDEGAEPACGSICERVAREASVLAISDCRSSGHPEAGGVGAYLGVPLAQDGIGFTGCFCVLQLEPRNWRADEIELLEELSRSALAVISPSSACLPTAGPPPLTPREHDETPAGETAVRERDELYRRIVETASEGIWISDAGGRITYVNEQAARMLGYAPREMLGCRIHDFIPEDDHPHLDMRLGRRRQGIAEQYDARCQHRDGSLVWVLISATPLQGERGDYLGTLAMLSDITGRREVEEALRASEARFRAIFGEAGIGIALVTSSGRLLESNRALQQWLGYTGQELRALGIDGITHPDHLVNDLELAEELFAGVRESYQIEKRYLRKDGRVVWGRLTASLVRDGSRLPQFGVGMVEDITERKRAEERNTEFRTLGQLLNTAATPKEAACIVLDVADRLLGWDACWIELIDPTHQQGTAVICMDEICGVRTEVPPIDLDTAVSPFALQAIAEGGVLVLRQPATMPKPHSATFGDVGRPSASLMCVPIRNSTRAIGALSIQTYRFDAYDRADVDTLQALADYCAGAFERTQAEAARQALQEQLSHAQKMEAIGRLAGGVAHDFNNMLGVINGYSELLLSRADLASTAHQPLQEILGAGKRAASLTRQLLAFSRKELIRPQVLDLGALVSNTQRLLQRLIGEDIELITHPDTGSGSVRADPGQLEQVLLNLAINARDAMPQGGKLVVGVEPVTLAAPLCTGEDKAPAGSYVCLLVSDSGSGMDPETLSHIFEPFYTTKPAGQGTGLGLATVYGIVKQNGGYIEVQSASGLGTTFRIYLPRLGGLEAGAGPEIDPQRPQGKETILVAEDEAMLRRLASDVLRMSGYDVIEAANADEALEQFRNHPGRIHLLLTDVVMPGRSGRELAMLLTADHPELPVIYMSGYTDDAVVRHGVHSSEVHFLQKPFSPATLAQKIRQVLDSQ